MVPRRSLRRLCFAATAIRVRRLSRVPMEAIHDESVADWSRALVPGSPPQARPPATHPPLDRPSRTCPLLLTSFVYRSTPAVIQNPPAEYKALPPKRTSRGIPLPGNANANAHTMHAAWRASSIYRPLLCSRTDFRANSPCFSFSSSYLAYALGSLGKQGRKKKRLPRRQRIVLVERIKPPPSNSRRCVEEQWLSFPREQASPGHRR